MTTLFSTPLRRQHKILVRRFDNILQLMNSPLDTIERDAHHCIFAIQKLIASISHDAEVEHEYNPHSLNFHLPSDWMTDDTPYWSLQLDQVVVPYEDLLDVPGVNLSLDSYSGTGTLVKSVEYTVGDVRGCCTVTAPVPDEDIYLLEAIGKIEHEYPTTEERVYLRC